MSKSKDKLSPLRFNCLKDKGGCGHEYGTDGSIVGYDEIEETITQKTLDSESTKVVHAGARFLFECPKCKKEHCMRMFILAGSSRYDEMVQAFNRRKYSRTL